MLYIMQNSFTYADRYFFKIHIGNFLSNSNNGCFVLSKDSSLKSESISGNGCFGAYIKDDFEVTGNAITIEFVGLNFNKNIISKILAGTPGDLSYIDGCSNSVIVPPPRNGDPCLNYLYFPPGIMQTRHTHPSIRLGYVLSGKGKAHLPNKDVDLNAGDVFLLERHALHNFSTSSNESMSLVVFHPDSESGPTDEFNPMKSRTYIQR